MSKQKYIKWFESIGSKDVESVGGKNGKKNKQFVHI